MNSQISKFDLKVKILSSVQVAEAHFHMTFYCPQIAAVAKPGQFIHLLIDHRLHPLLRRPFTIYRAKNEIIEILFQVIGCGTRLLSDKRPGDIVKIMGPLGNSFSIPPACACPHADRDDLKTAILIGGGVGIASLMMLAEELKRRGHRIIVLIGSQTAKRLLCVDEFQKVGADVYISTDDGSRGYRGFVTELLFKILEKPEIRKYEKTSYKLKHPLTQSPATSHQSPITIYACGPDEMLKTITKIAVDFHIPAQLALENRMGCGLGACLGCVLKIKSADGELKYECVCTKGPVFGTQEIVWE